jgi:hypothetical protein
MPRRAATAGRAQGAFQDFMTLKRRRGANLRAGDTPSMIRAAA